MSDSSSINKSGMKLFIFRIIVLFALINFIPLSSASGSWFKAENSTVQDTAKFVSRFEADNDRCFKCHGQEKYEYTNETLGKQVRDIMCSERIVRKNEFYSSNHKSFSCTDCHSDRYVKFPHSGELRMEQKYICIDCHGGDEKFAKYHFEEIEAEYQKSTHFKMENDGFSCWKCHNPHTYKISVRNNTNLKETIAYDNAICLNCHSNFSNFQLISDKAEIDIIQKHGWLPNQALHFANVRCIECHTKINNNIPVSHQIRPKGEAVRLCNECHSKNSILMASLYKFESKEQRRDGFFNGIILNASYVIGANRNEYLNLLSLIILAVVLVVITIHIIFRIKGKRKNR
jgi:Zn finger protein HypA/HybF involved in hydrogenase expression